MREPVHEADVAWETWYRGTRRALRSKALCDVGGATRLGVGLLELAPGSHTKPAHFHSLEEEHLYALSGRAVLHLGERRFELRPGSYVCFPAGAPVPHHLENDSPQPFTYLMIGERIAGDVVTHVGEPEPEPR